MIWRIGCLKSWASAYAKFSSSARCSSITRAWARFGDVVGHPAAQRLRHQHLVADAGDEDDRQIGVGGPELARERQAVELRHVVVENHTIEALIVADLPDRRRIRDRSERGAGKGRAESQPHDLAFGVAVVDEQQVFAPRHAQSPR
jgi:hypothetical protein